jgi:hypothetical protein
MCCGSKRSALRNTSIRLKAQTTAPPVSREPEAPIASRDQLPGASGPNGVAPSVPISARRPSASVILQYKESMAIRVRGPVTGRLYEFSIAQPAQHVEPRDAAVLTHSGLFFRV